MSGQGLIFLATCFELFDHSVSLNTVHDLIDILSFILAITNGVAFLRRNVSWNVEMERTGENCVES